MLVSLDVLHLGRPGSDLGGTYSTARSCPTLYDPMDWSPPALLCPWNSLGKNTGVGFHFLLQGIFPTRGIEPMSPELASRFLTTEPPREPWVVGIDKC